jgi:transcriptional regulator with XRE-family HTH domain
MARENSFGDMVRNRRKELRYRQSEFAELMGITQGMVSRYEGGQEPELPTLRKMAKVLEARIVVHPDQRVEMAPEHGYLPLVRGIPLSHHLGFEVGKPLRSEMRNGIRKVVSDEGISVALRVFADEVKEPAQQLFMRVTGTKKSSGLACLSKLFGNRCDNYRGKSHLHEPPHVDHAQLYLREGVPTYYVMHLYKMSGGQARDVSEFCEENGLACLIWPHLNWYFPGSAMAVIIQRKSDAVDLNF